MWQLLLVAVAAVSTSFIAKHFLNHDHDEEEQKPLQESIIIDSAFATPAVATNLEQQRSFNISSSAAASSSSSLSSSGKKIRKKSAIKACRLNFGAEIDQKIQRSAGYEGSSRRFYVSLKKRRTATAAKILPSKYRSRSSKDGDLFNWGLTVGIMRMMSAGKAEISKLSSAMDETSKVVQELRTELYKRKSAHVATASSEDISCKHNQRMLSSSATEDRGPKDIKVSGAPMIDDVECPSSAEEPDPQVLEMDQLEAELASEQQKLTWSDTKPSGREKAGPSMSKDVVSSGGITEVVRQDTAAFIWQGVLPSDLDMKQCRLIIGQQDNQILDLEYELHMTKYKLYEKEGELEALKNCVKRLSELSVSTALDDADDEPKVQAEQDCNSEWDNNSKIESQFEPRKSVIGMKRSISFA